MPASIRVEPGTQGLYRVTIIEGATQTTHSVSLSSDYYEKLTGGKVSEELLVERSFQFLLERESKESILREFDLPLIGHYFPNYESEIRRRLMP